MEILKYTEENLETIAKETLKSIEEVTEDFKRSIELEMKIYSVKNFISFGTTKLMKDVYFVSDEIIEEWYEEDTPQKPKQYTKVSLKHKKMPVYR